MAICYLLLARINSGQLKSTVKNCFHGANKMSKMLAHIIFIAEQINIPKGNCQ